MLDFMDYVQNAFYEASHWNRNNSYGTLTATSQASYRQLVPLRPPDPPWWWEIWRAGKRVDTRDALLYGRLYLPRSTLEALYLRRLSPTSQLKINAVSDARLPNGGSALALLAQDKGKWSAEYMYSTDSALLGVRGLYNFGPDPRLGTALVPAVEDAAAMLSEPQSVPKKEKGAGEQVSRFSAGAEVYYGLLNKSGGMSTGFRFATLPAHTGFPYTMTLTLNPLMGNLSSSYSVRAGELLSLSSRFDFNVYSYESGVVMGMELWKLRDLNGGLDGQLSRDEEIRLGRAKKTIEDGRKGSLFGEEITGDGNDVAGCLKARVDQRGNVGLLWEGRVKELVYSCGASIDLRAGKDIISGVGLELQYSV
ncbi:MAG: hypothetical protein Q9219_001432 [cf. Caloplaca sp. 3 TL-2023]